MIFLNRNHKKGVTLVEMMIAILLFGIVIAIGYTFLNRTFISLERQRQSLDTLHEARNFLMNIERDLREATEITRLDTVFRNNLFDDENALLHRITMRVPARDGSGMQTVSYIYEGPDYHSDVPGQAKVIYREVEGGVRRPIITGQLNYLKVWGTDGTIFRNRHPEESMADYRKYLRPSYYSPSNNAPGGLRSLQGIRGVEIQLSMHELLDSRGEPIKQRTFITRIYPRILNPKYHN